MQAPKDKLVEQNRRRNLEDLAVVQLVPAAVLGPSLQIRVAHALLRSLHARHFTIVVLCESYAARNPWGKQEGARKRCRCCHGGAGAIGRKCEGQRSDETVRSPVIRRTRRWCVKYAQAHSVITTKRLRNPISQKMCRKIQKIHAMKPEIFRPKTSPTAALRPIVAMMP